jgi:integral membrane sensor domain MASE1
MTVLDEFGAYINGYRAGASSVTDEERIMYTLASIVLAVVIACILGSLIGDALLSFQGKSDA